MTAAIRARSVLVRTDSGVWRMSLMKSAVEAGASVAGFAVGRLIRYFSSLGSIKRTNFCKN